MKVLLVEDNPHQALVAQSYLELVLPDLELTHVLTLADGLAAVGGEAFEAILLDLGLPDGDGLEVVILMCEAAANIPVIILTAQGEEGLGPLCIQAGATDFVSKIDMTPEKLAKAVEFGASRRTESVVRDLSRIVSDFRSVAGQGPSGLADDFSTVYERLLTEPNFLMTPEHEKLIHMLGEKGATGAQVISLHAECIESVCRAADDRARARYLANCSTVLASTLRYLVDYYRSKSS